MHGRGPERWIRTIDDMLLESTVLPLNYLRLVDGAGI